MAVAGGGGLGFARAVGGLAVRHAVEYREPDADAEARDFRADPVGHGEEEARAVLEAAAVAAFAVARAQQLVAEVSVAVLDVDELKPDGVGAARGLDEVGNEAIDVLVFHQRDAAGKAFVEDRVEMRGERLRTVPDVRARETPRVRELETEIEIAVGVRAEPLAVRGDELVSERGERAAHCAPT